MLKTNSIHTLIEAQAVINPAGNAIEVSGGEITYDQLNRRSNQLAEYLRLSGVTPGAPLAVAMDLSLDLFVVMLALLKIGAVAGTADQRRAGAAPVRSVSGFVVTDDNHAVNAGDWTVIDIPSERGLIAFMPDGNPSPSIVEIPNASLGATVSGQLSRKIA